MSFCRATRICSARYPRLRPPQQRLTTKVHQRRHLIRRHRRLQKRLAKAVQRPVLVSQDGVRVRLQSLPRCRVSRIPHFHSAPFKHVRHICIKQTTVVTATPSGRRLRRKLADAAPLGLAYGQFPGMPRLPPLVPLPVSSKLETIKGSAFRSTVPQWLRSRVTGLC